MRSLFVCDPRDLEAEVKGGVQICSDEFLRVVRAASESVEIVNVSVTRALSWRMRRRLGLGSYLRYRPSEFEPSFRAYEKEAPTHVFLNRAELLRFAPFVRRIFPDVCIVILSHGNQSGDDLYEVAGPAGHRASGLKHFFGRLRLGNDLVTESQYRHRQLDGVCAMSAEECILEQWLGAKKTLVLPRLIRLEPIDWAPVRGRVGFVGTLNHTPNRVALELLCAALETLSFEDLEIRIVGGPVDVGADFEDAYSFVKYVGRLSDEELHEEVVSWSLFLNPIFWLSRGASMKLGQSLSWCIPAVTTGAGMRGYEIPERNVIAVENDVSEFAERLIESLQNPEQQKRIRRALLDSAGKYPSESSLGERLREVFA